MSTPHIRDSARAGDASFLSAHQAELAALCRAFHVKRLELFGSALGSGFDPARSDLDFVVEFAPLAPTAYATAFFAFKEALERLFERSVDLIVLSAIRNPYFRRQVEQRKALIYAA
jgi:predicted nucleotidyltransferase